MQLISTITQSSESRQRTSTNSVIIYAISACLVILSFQVFAVAGHGRLIEPPSRASAWRYGFDTPPDYNDHELFCGGFTRQYERNKGQCGVCGDAWDLPKPRPHEIGGKWGQGVIVRKYNPSKIFTIRIELTASHYGYFEFRLCDSVNSTQSCLDKHLLKIVTGTPSAPLPNDLDTRFYPRNGTRIYDIKAQLPNGLECKHCVLQWIYIAGNNWGICPDGHGAVGCGNQEEFRSCADVEIGKGSTSIIPVIRPTTRPPSFTKPTTAKYPVTTEVAGPGEGQGPQGSNFLGALIAMVSFFLVFCGLAAVYLYSYHGLRIKHWLNKNRHGKVPTGSDSSSTSSSSIGIPETPPVAPPRTKRIQSVQNMTDDSNIFSITSNNNKLKSDLMLKPPESA